jgi:sulfur-carrier protein
VTSLIPRKPRGTVNVRAEFYSRLREIVGAPAIDVELPENATVRTLIDELLRAHSRLRDYENSMLCGIGVEFAGRDQPLKDGDVVAVMPPVQGG